MDFTFYLLGVSKHNVKAMILNTNRVKVKKKKKKKQEVVFFVRAAEMEGESRRLFKTFLLKLVRIKMVLI